jgi:hypothetical protein
MKPTSAKIFLLIISVTGWFALIAQFYLIIANRVTSIPETIIRYFSFYTILTNIIVALCATVLLLKPVSRWGKFFSRQTTPTAISLYITIVGLVYNIILRQLWKPEGLQMIVDELLHTLIPVLFLLLWLVFVSKNKLNWKNILPWMIYPLIYSIFILTRGKISGFYPYPFMDIGKLGFNKVLLNSCILLIVFLAFSFLFVGIGKLMKKTSSRI